MNELCDRAQDALAEGGVASLSLAQKEHVAGCEACSGVLLALSSLDDALGDWTAPPKPSGLDAAVAAAVAADPVDDDVELEEVVAPTVPWWRRRPSVRRSAFVASLGLLLLTGVAMMTLYRSNLAYELGPRALFETADAEIDTIDANLDGGWAGGRRVNLPSVGAPAGAPADVVTQAGELPEADRDGLVDGAKAGRLDRSSDAWKAMDPDGDGMRRPSESLEGKNYEDVFRPEMRKRIQNRRTTDKHERSVSILMPPPDRRGAARKSKESDRSAKELPAPSEPLPLPAEEQRDEGEERDALVEEPAVDLPRLEKQAAAKGLLALIGATGENGADLGVADLLADTRGNELSGDVRRALAGLRSPATAPPPPPDGIDDDFAWLSERSAIDVATVPAAGYWANTYVPGDPALRRLESSVRRQQEQRASAGADTPPLDALARQVRQPFDPPTDGALAVYLHADRRGISEATRMRIQVGLQGTTRRSGRRPAMNVGVVLDLRGSHAAEDEAAMRALIDALVQARDLGDTFSVTVAGRPGGQIVPSESFRYGPVRLAMEGLFGGGTSGELLGLPAAMQRAIDTVSATDDPNRPLGSSVVLLVSPTDLAADAPTLEAMAHRSAVAGVPVSVVGVGARADHARLESIALAGQGNRRVLPSASEAADVVDRELSAASRVVARAVRLRIRLAPGVKLVDVLGSHDLDAAASQRVRDAEQSIDRRLARNLGIQADRGDDEEGIQIVIPTWYAGDGHAILLDIVAPGPGPIADVSVKYKDLVRLDNGVARASLRLGHDPHPPGPLELNVLKNEVAHELSLRLADASELVRRGQPSDAARGLRDAHAWLLGLQEAVPTLRGDRELRRDFELLADSAAALDGSRGAESYRFLGDSLRLAARRKVLAPLAEDTPGAD